MPKDLQQLQPPPADGDEPMLDGRADEPAAPGAAATPAPPPAEGAAPWYDADRQATSLPATAEEASDASGSGAPRPSEPAAQPQKKPSSRRRARPLAPPGVQLSADERTALERERNREHARNTRARKKEAIEKLKHDVEAWEVETRRTEERRAVKERKSERHERLLAEVFRARGEAVVDPEVWASWLAPGFELWQPQSDYVAHRPSDVVRERRVSRGVAGMADDVAAWAVFMHGVGRSGAFSSRMAEPPAYECRHIHADDKVDPSTFGMFGAGGAPPRRPPPPASSPRVRDDEVSTDDEDARERRVAYARDTIMGFWALRTLDAQRHGARCEVALRGMYCARFVGGGDATAENPIKLLRLELAYDMQSFARTVEAAASAPLPYAPNSLYDATFHDDPRAKVVTTARRPFVIANVNQAWLDLCGFGKDEVLGRTMSCIQGELTDKRAVESVHAAVAAGRAADMTLINYTSKGDAFLNYLRVFPLYADANPNQRPSNYLGILEDHAKRRHAKLDDGPTA
ncbi:hypothetical protein SO694_00083173 [Aureococcus anophagefferens]|uniref:FHA domain-containing protein n=1 Tax=Aureococcus anophagefferens TaxID=44056 RepID=A0ABR1FJD6_AURAN